MRGRQQNGKDNPGVTAEPRVARFFLGGDEMAVISFAPRGAHCDDPRLSPAEQEVAALVLEGLSNAEISARRGTAVRTVANQLASLFGKLGISSRNDLAAALEGAVDDAS